VVVAERVPPRNERRGVMFTAKPKLNNHLDVREFEVVLDAVKYLNEYNKMGKQFQDEHGQFVPTMKAEDWWLLGKLSAPEGFEFRDNRLVESKQ